MFMIPAVVLGYALIPRVAADLCSSGQYTSLLNFIEPNACVPSGYLQTQDLGSTNRDDLIDTCEERCNAIGPNCQAFVGTLWKAADSDAATGTCFFYATAPEEPAGCSDYPTEIIGEAKSILDVCLDVSLGTASPTADELPEETAASEETASTEESTHRREHHRTRSHHRDDRAVHSTTKAAPSTIKEALRTATPSTAAPHSSKAARALHSSAKAAVSTSASSSTKSVSKAARAVHTETKETVKPTTLLTKTVASSTSKTTTTTTKH